jgi:cytochrome b involved in lipid metabolism
MKKLITISLFIFGVAVAAILIAGLVFQQEKKNIQTTNNQPANIKSTNTTPNITSQTTTTTKIPVKNPVTPVVKKITLNMAEISKHNSESDCWMLINGKVYDITSYFGNHPGGNGTMAATCGTDATDAYMTKDPYASSSGNRSAHSSRAQGLLTNYFVGNFNTTISN